MGISPNHLPRAERYAIPVAILYRGAGEADWNTGITENISRSGVLFKGSHRLEPDTPLEMMLDLPSVVAAPMPYSLRRGRVVRAIAPDVYEDRPSFAAAFIDIPYTPPSDPRRI